MGRISWRDAASTLRARYCQVRPEDAGFTRERERGGRPSGGLLRRRSASSEPKWLNRRSGEEVFVGFNTEVLNFFGSGGILLRLRFAGLRLRGGAAWLRGSSAGSLPALELRHVVIVVRLSLGGYAKRRGGVCRALALRCCLVAPRWVWSWSPPGGPRSQGSSLPRPTFMGRVPCLLELPLALGVASALLFPFFVLVLFLSSLRRHFGSSDMVALPPDRTDRGNLLPLAQEPAPCFV